MLAYPGQQNAIFEVFRTEDVPAQATQSSAAGAGPITTDDIF
jgi:penicillin-binding protein 1A